MISSIPISHSQIPKIRTCWVLGNTSAMTEDIGFSIRRALLLDPWTARSAKKAPKPEK